MWQHHYLLHRARMDALRAEAERERRWRLQNEANGRSAPGRPPRPRASAGRALAAGWLAAASRAGARLARRLDEQVVLDLGPERLARDG